MKRRIPVTVLLFGNLSRLENFKVFFFWLSLLSLSLSLSQLFYNPHYELVNFRTRLVLKAAPTDEEKEDLTGGLASRPGLESQDHHLPSVLSTSLRLGFG